MQSDNIKFEPLLVNDICVGVICHIDDLDTLHRYLIGYKASNGKDIWWGKKKTPNSTVALSDSEVSKTLDKYHLKKLIRMQYREMAEQ